MSTNPEKVEPFLRRIQRIFLAAMLAITLATAADRGANAQEPNPIPAPAAQDLIFKAYLPEVQNNEQTLEQKQWTEFVRLFQNLTGEDLFSNNPDFSIKENNQDWVEGKKEFVAVSNDFLAIANKMVDEWNRITSQNGHSGYEPSNGGYQAITIDMVTGADTSLGRVLILPDANSDRLCIQVEKGSIFSIAQMIAELMVPQSALNGGFGNSEAVRKGQVRALAIELAVRYYNYFNNELHPAALILYRADGTPFFPTKEEYLNKFREEMLRWQNPTSTLDPLPVKVELVNGVYMPTYGYNALPTSYEGTSPHAEMITNSYAVKVNHVYQDALNQWIQKGNTITHPEFLLLSRLPFMQAEDEFGFFKRLTDALGNTELVAFIRQELKRAGFILPEDEFVRQREVIQQSQWAKPSITFFEVFGNVGDREGITVLSAVQSSTNFQGGDVRSTLDSFETHRDLQQHPIVEAAYYIKSPRTPASFWVRIPPIAPVQLGEGEFQYVFPYRFSVVDVDGQVTFVDLSGQSVFVKVQVTQAEIDANGNRRVQIREQVALFESNSAVQAETANPVEPDASAHIVDMIPQAQFIVH